MFEKMPVNTLQTHQTETQVATTAHARFIDQGDGTVRDVRTGLMWTRCDVGQTWIENRCIGNPELLPWNRATLLSISAGGFSDWRLPTLIELKGLIDRQYGRPAIEPSVFFGFEGDAFYWTIRISGKKSEKIYAVNPTAEFNRAPITQIKGLPFDLMTLFLKGR